MAFHLHLHSLSSDASAVDSFTLTPSPLVGPVGNLAPKRINGEHKKKTCASEAWTRFCWLIKNGEERAADWARWHQRNIILLERPFVVGFHCSLIQLSEWPFIYFSALFQRRGRQRAAPGVLRTTVRKLSHHCSTAGWRELIHPPPVPHTHTHHHPATPPPFVAVLPPLCC